MTAVGWIDIARASLGPWFPCSPEAISASFLVREVFTRIRSISDFYTRLHRCSHAYRLQSARGCSDIGRLRINHPPRGVGRIECLDRCVQSVDVCGRCQTGWLSANLRLLRDGGGTICPGGTQQSSSVMPPANGLPVGGRWDPQQTMPQGSGQSFELPDLRQGFWIDRGERRIAVLCFRPRSFPDSASCNSLTTSIGRSPVRTTCR